MRKEGVRGQELEFIGEEYRRGRRRLWNIRLPKINLYFCAETLDSSSLVFINCGYTVFFFFSASRTLSWP